MKYLLWAYHECFLSLDRRSCCIIIKKSSTFGKKVRFNQFFVSLLVVFSINVYAINAVYFSILNHSSFTVVAKEGEAQKEYRIAPKATKDIGMTSKVVQAFFTNILLSNDFGVYINKPSMYYLDKSGESHKLEGCYFQPYYSRSLVVEVTDNDGLPRCAVIPQ